jgi:peptide/nickel transport system permease protein
MASQAGPVPGVLGSPALRLAGTRLLTAVPVLWGATFLTFVVVNLLPGNSAQEILGANASPGQVRALYLKLHLNEPFWVRYGHWLGGVLQGHLGVSLLSGQPVSATVAQRLPVTAELVLYAFVIATVPAVVVAVLAASRPGGLADRLSLLASMAGLSVPPYVLAPVLVLVFAVSLRILPAIGFVPVAQGLGGNVRSLTLPALSIGFPLFCFNTRLLRAELGEQMRRADYVVTAMAKGIGTWQVLLRHALRNSLFGFLTVAGLNLGTLLGGTVIVEQIFSLPGLGQELIQAIGVRDVPVIEAVVLVFAAAVVLANLLADLLYAALDPRISYDRAAA